MQLFHDRGLEVLAEVLVVVGPGARGHAARDREPGLLPIVAVDLVAGQGADVAPVDEQRRVKQRRPHPQQQVRSVGLVGRPVRRRSGDAGMDAAQRGGGLGRGLAVAERDPARHVDRAIQPPPGIGVVAGVLLDTRGDQRVRDLQQQRGARAEHRPRVPRVGPRDRARARREPARLLFSGQQWY
jgi:hypothetical protein